MVVYGINITDEQKKSCLQAMKGRFGITDITNAAMAAGIPEFVNIGKVTAEHLAYRVADRLIQAQKKSGLIAREGRYWIAVESNG